MKVCMVALATILIAAVTLVPACKPTPEQAKVIAQNTGMFTAVAWIAKDNPSVEAKDAAKEALGVINEKADEVTAGKTYSEVVYPALVVYIDVKLDAQYRPLAKAAAISVLGGVDTLFALNPEWKDDEALALGIVKAFVRGAQAGLGLDETHPAIVEAKKIAAARAKIKGLQ